MDENKKPNEDVFIKSGSLENQEISDEDLGKINQLALTKLSKEELFAFKIIMSTNEVDREYEVVPKSSLEQMKELFVGKTLIKDHNWKADSQIGRIYATELIQDGDYTRNNEPHCSLIAHCYMVKTDGNKDLIAEIKAGIKKEISIGFRSKKSVCSICGIDNRRKYCDHYWGKEYDGKTCYFILEDITDVYEASLVSVPANKEARTTKNYKLNNCDDGKTEVSISNEMEQKQMKLKVNNRLRDAQSFLFVENEREGI